MPFFRGKNAGNDLFKSSMDTKPFRSKFNIRRAVDYLVDVEMHNMQKFLKRILMKSTKNDNMERIRYIRPKCMR